MGSRPPAQLRRTGKIFSFYDPAGFGHRRRLALGRAGQQRGGALDHRRGQDNPQLFAENIFIYKRRLVLPKRSFYKSHRTNKKSGGQLHLMGLYSTERFIVILNTCAPCLIWPNRTNCRPFCIFFTDGKDAYKKEGGGIFRRAGKKSGGKLSRHKNRFHYRPRIRYGQKRRLGKNPKSLRTFYRRQRKFF